MKFQTYPKLHQVEQGDSPYADARNHCQRYDYYSARGQRVTSVHECTHGINSQLRNRPLLMPTMPYFAMAMSREPDISKGKADMCSVPMPHTLGAGGSNAGFYLLQDRAIILTNPPGTILAAARLVPSSAHYSRFNLYMVQQAAQWNSEPLYIFDEWVAYRNGAQCLIWDAQHGGTRDGNSDFIFAPLEFCTYGIAVLMMAKDSLTADLKEFARWLVIESINAYLIGKQYAPWAQADNLFDQFHHSSDFIPIRQFCRNVLEFGIPNAVTNPNTTDNLLI